jgi:hypothetical protein
LNESQANEVQLNGPLAFEASRPLPHGVARVNHDSRELVGPPLPDGEAAELPSTEGALDPELPTPVVEAPAVAGAPPSWQRFANAGEYETALFVLGQNGGFEKALAEASAEQLMLLSDVASATGQRQRSISALRRVVQDFPADPVAPLAAWSLGKQLEKVGDKLGALKAFADYRALSPEGDFAEDALVRQIKDAAERGDRALLGTLATQYQHDFPSGRRASDVARWLSQGNDGALLDAGSEAVSPDEDDEPAAKPSEPAKSEGKSEPAKSEGKSEPAKPEHGKESPEPPKSESSKSAQSKP